MPAYSQPNSAGALVKSEALISAQTITATTNVAAGSGWSQVARLKLQLIAASVAGTTPSYTVKLQDSGDGTNWVDVASGAFSAVTANGTSSLVLNPIVLQDNVRVVVTVTGTTPTAAITLLATSVAHFDGV